MATNFKRSSSGFAGSSASRSTRRLNSSHDSSRFRNNGTASPAGAGGSALRLNGWDRVSDKGSSAGGPAPEFCHIPGGSGV